MNRFSRMTASWAVAAGVILILSACGSKEDPSRAVAKSHQPMGPPTKSAEIAEVTLEAPLDKVYEPYLAIGKALGNDSLEGVVDHANAIAVAVTDDTSGILSKGLVEPARALAAAENIEAARKAFGSLSAKMIDLADQRNLRNTGLTMIFCSMEEEGAWLQAGKTVHNPYAGKRMQKCGELKREY